MLVTYKRFEAIKKAAILETLIVNDVNPIRITNGLAGSAHEWASYWLYDEGAYEADVTLEPMLGEDVIVIKAVFHEFYTYQKIDLLLKNLGFREEFTKRKNPRSTKDITEYLTPAS